MNRPGLLFDRESIRHLCPSDVPTVYRLYRNETLVYVGASTDPRRRLLEHLRSLPGTPTHVTLEFCGTTTMMARKECEAMTEGPQIRTHGRRHASWKAQPKRSKPFAPRRCTCGQFPDVCARYGCLK